MLYALSKFKVIAALVSGHWVMGISAGWFRVRGIKWLVIGNHGLRAFRQMEITCELQITFEPPAKKKKKKRKKKV